MAEAGAEAAADEAARDLRERLDRFGPARVAEVLGQFEMYVANQPWGDGHPPMFGLVCRRPHARDDLGEGLNGGVDGPASQPCVLVPATLIEEEEGQPGIDLFGTGAFATQVGLPLSRLVLDVLEHEEESGHGEAGR